MGKQNRNKNQNSNNTQKNSQVKQRSQYREKGTVARGRQTQVNSAPFKKQFTKNNSNKRVRQTAEISDTAAALSRDNPVSFYTKFSQYSTDAASLPFATPLGAVIDVDDSNFPTCYVVPGIMRIAYVPTIGISDDFTSPINRSSIRFYTYLRSNQKASGAYDHQDVTMMEIALDSGYSFHAMCRRIYGVMNQFSPRNEYYARSLVAALGCNFTDLRQHLQDFRAFINNFAYQLGQYALPQGITLFDRHRWMCEGLYVDSDSSRAQTYVFVPKGFWIYDNSVTTGSQCVWEEFVPDGTTPKQYTFSDLVALGTKIINAVSNEEDFAIISGDIYNFYGGNTYQLPYVEEGYQIFPSFEKTVLTQIENLTLVGPLENLVITQNPDVNQGAILFHPKLKIQQQCLSSYLNFHWDSPSPEEVIEATRLTATFGPDTGDTAMTLTGCGTEIISKLDVFSLNPATLAPRFNPIATQVLVLNETSLPNLIADYRDIMHMAQFDWAPNLRLYGFTGDGSDEQLLGWTWDIDNMQKIDNMFIQQIHTACLYSLFEVGTNAER